RLPCTRPASACRQHASRAPESTRTASAARLSRGGQRYGSFHDHDLLDRSWSSPRSAAPTVGLGRSREPSKILLDFLCRSHTTFVVRRRGQKGEVVLAANMRPGGAGEDDDVERAEDGVDRKAAEAKFAQVRASEQCARCLKQLGGRWCGGGHAVHR